MRSKLLIIIAVVIALGFFAFAFTEQIRFNQSAVKATFGKADADSVIDTPGLIFRFPKPIQSVTIYDTRQRFLETRSETQQTADNRQIIVQAFLVWRINDPLLFFKSFGDQGAEQRHYAEAERTLQSQLRSALSEVSQYRLDELFSPEQGASRIGELEKVILDRLSDTSGVSGSAPTGIETVLVGINRIVLPEDTTKTVLERMSATQNRIAAEAQSAGSALAATIRARAESDASRIRSFAEQRAQRIRNRGDEEASRYFEELNAAPELAIFLEKIKNLRETWGKDATLIIPTSTPGMSVFHPDFLSTMGPDGFPVEKSSADASNGASQ